MDAAALPTLVQHSDGGHLDLFVGVGDDELDAAPGELAQERGPERLGFGRTDIHAEHFAPAVAVEADRNDQRDRYDVPHSGAPSRRWRGSTDAASRPRSGGRETSSLVIYLIQTLGTNSELHNIRGTVSPEHTKPGLDRNRAGTAHNRDKAIDVLAELDWMADQGHRKGLR